VTLVDRVIPLYIWFIWGFGFLSVFIGLINFGMSIVTMITVKGIYIPLWIIPIVAGSVFLLCTFLGFIAERYDVWNRITSHQNLNANPEFKKLCTDVAALRKDFNPELPKD
jgi:hypothetical protein